MALLPLPALARQSVNFAVYIDPTRALTIAEVQDKPFSPIIATFGGGFTRSIYWLRITVDDPEAGNIRLGLRPPTTDRIELFTPIEGGWRVSQNGERALPTQDAVPSINSYAFSLSPERDRGPWYVRIDTTAPGALTVTAIPSDEILRDEIATSAWGILTFSLLCFAAVLVVGTLAPLHAPANLGFLAMLATLSAYLYIVNGFSQALDRLPPGTAEAVQEFFACLAVFSIIAFHHFFLRDHEPARFAQRTSLALVGVSALGPLARLAGNGHLGIAIALYSYVLVVPVLLLVLATMRSDVPSKRGPLRCIYAAYLAFLSFNITARFGLVDAEFLYRHSVEALSVVSCTLILSLLWLRNKTVRKAEAEHAFALQSLSVDIEVDRQFRAAQLDLIQRIDAQAERVATATRSLVASGALQATSARAERAVTTLRRIIDRCHLAHRSTENRWNLRPVRFCPATVLKGLAETLGPPSDVHLDTGDTAGFMVTSDRDLFELAAENVLANALRYGTAGEPVRVTLKRTGLRGQAGLSIRVENTATMQTPFETGKVFEKFYRGPSAQGLGGTGLGLFITRDVMQALSGQVSLSSRATPHGSEVTLTLWLPEHP